MATEQTIRTGLQEPILRGIQNNHFFNGRLLTALDLNTEQEANRRQRRQLGQAIGAGIVHGLEVALGADGSDGQPPIVSVTKGLALNRLGQVIELPLDIEVRLAPQSQSLLPEGGLFVECQPPTADTPPGTGAYILVAAPASGFREKVPRRGFGQNGKVDGCGNRYTVEGIKFRLEALTVNSLTGVSQDTRDALDNLMAEIDALKVRIDPAGVSQRRAGLSKLRNWLAHLCFGTEALINFRRDPLQQVGGQSPYLTYGVMDDLRTAGKLTDCDVPVALLYWTTNQVHFVDMWSARRRLLSGPLSERWPLLVSDRRISETEASFLQFQSQALSLINSELSFNAAALMQATDYFRYLPPMGFLPIRRDSQRGINLDNFFIHQPHREPEFIDSALVSAVLHQAMTYESIDVSEKEMVWIYKVWQNEQAIDGEAQAQPHIIFTNAHIPYRATARFDVSRWNYSNYTKL